MAFEFRLPDIGEGVAEGEIVKWFVAEGDTVESDQPMVEVLTDKANVEIPAPRAGTILRILAHEGDTVPVESVLVVIGDPGESLPAGAAAEAHPQRAEGAPPAAGERGTEAAEAPAAARAGVREQPDAPAGPARSVEREEKQARGGRSGRGAARSAAAGAGNGRGAAARAAGDGGEEQAGSRTARRGRGGRLQPNDRVLAMPGVRRFAKERGVDLTQVEGSGSQGHVLREDVERFLAEREEPAARPAAATAGPPPPRAAPVRARPAPRRPDAEAAEDEVLPYRGVRRQIGRKMAQSVYTAPHYTYVEEVDAGALVALRTSGQAFAEEHGVKLTYLPFILKALVPCLRAFPLLNAVLDEEGQQIRLKKRYNVGVATSSEEGLIVPVVKDVDRLSVLEIAGEIRRLSEAVRDRSITIEELKDSTFTVTSLGPLGGLLATPIINFPEVAILGVHAIKQKPVVRDGALAVGHVMNLSLSFDHRVVDGAVGAQFTRMLVRYLESPQLLLLEG
ncbi:MAG: dihydrolipoamide acetyltransferase family protein [Gemmatimonadota bacterium]